MEAIRKQWLDFPISSGLPRKNKEVLMETVAGSSGMEHQI